MLVTDTAWPLHCTVFMVLLILILNPPDFQKLFSKLYMRAGSTAACDFGKNLCQQGAICAEYVPGQDSGHCVNSTVKFVPSYSTRLECKVGSANVDGNLQ